MPLKKVSIIILTWNGLSYTKQCLESLRTHTVFDDYEIIVVDNGSNDGTLKYLESLPWIRLIKNASNLGFTKGNNVALRATFDTDVVLLNNDMVIIQNDWLTRLQNTAHRNSTIGIVGCRLTSGNGILQHAGSYIRKETYWGQQIGGGQADINQYTQVREVEGVVFACAYIKREVLNKVGLLDEDYFAYFEDTDYCFKAREKGYKTVCSGDVTLVHFQNVSTSENKVSFSNIFLKSQGVFKRKWGRKLERSGSHALGWHSIVNFPSGYALSSRNIMLSLDEKGIDVRYRYVYGEGTPFPVVENEHSDNYLINVIRGRTFLANCPQVVYGQGDVFSRNSGAYKVGFTMLEVTGIPKTWVDNANRMDEIWVPSHFNVQTFRDSGVKVPIHVIPLGIDPHFFNPDINSFRPGQAYVFLSVFEWGERKDPGKLLRAFAREFRRHEDVMLICKVINNDGSVNIPQEITDLLLPADHAPVVIALNYPVAGFHRDVTFMFTPEIPDYQLGTLYRSADCFVLPTRGEGWGMPILEAMACGLPVITTNWSAQTDFINEHNAYLLHVRRLIDAQAKCPYYAGFQWADADENHLMQLMRHVFDHPEEAAAKGRFASQEVLSRWTWENSADRIIERLRAIKED